MAKTKEETNAYHRSWRSRNKDKTKAINFKYKYGLTADEYDTMLRKQGGKCAICLVDFDVTTKETSPHVDHCHITKRVRGLLCNRCNSGLGQFSDDLGLLTRAIAYLTPRGSH